RHAPLPALARSRRSPHSRGGDTGGAPRPGRLNTVGVALRRRNRTSLTLERPSPHPGRCCPPTGVHPPGYSGRWTPEGCRRGGAAGAVAGQARGPSGRRGTGQISPIPAIRSGDHGVVVAAAAGLTKCSWIVG